MSLWSMAKKAGAASAGLAVSGAKLAAGAAWKDSGAADIKMLNPASKAVNRVTSNGSSHPKKQGDDTADRQLQTASKLNNARQALAAKRSQAKTKKDDDADMKMRREEAKFSRMRMDREKRDDLQRGHMELSRGGIGSNVIASARDGEEFPNDVRVNIKGIRETLEDMIKQGGGLMGGGGMLGGAAGGALAAALAAYLKGKGGKLGKVGSLIGAAYGIDIPEVGQRQGPQTTVDGKAAKQAPGGGKQAPTPSGKNGNPQPTRVPTGTGKTPPVAGTASKAGRFGRIGGKLAGIASVGAMFGGDAIDAVKGAGSFVAEKASGAGKSVAEGFSRAKTAVAERTSKILDAGKGLVGMGGEKVAEKAGGKGAEKLATKGAAKAAGKMAIKKIPIIGLLAGVGFGIQRAAQGDWTGAGMEVASGLAGTIPGAGTAVGIGIDGALMARDALKTDGDNSVPQVDEKAAQKAAESIQAAPKMVSSTLSVNPAVTPAGARDDEERKMATGLASLDAFTRAAMDEKTGIYVKPAQNELTKRPEDQIGWAQQPTPKAYSVAERSPGPLGPQAPAVTSIPPGAVSDRPRFNAQGQQVAGVPGGGNNSAVPTRANTQNRDGSVQGFEGKGLAHSALGNLIARGEGDYDSYNAGTKGTGGKVKHSGKKDLANMTLDEIIKSSETKDGSDKDRVFAAGRYQIITPTLKDAMKKMNLKGDEKFTPELQDKIFEEHLMPKGARDFISGKSDDKEKAQIQLAQVWRSIADPRTGKTYADSGASANKASISSKEISAALDAAKTAKANGTLDAKIKPPTHVPNKANDATELVRAKEAEIERMEQKQKEANTPIVVSAPAPQQAPRNTATGGNTGVGGHMGTRNDDSSIRRLTDVKMSAGMV